MMTSRLARARRTIHRCGEAFICPPVYTSFLGKVGGKVRAKCCEKWVRCCPEITRDEAAIDFALLEESYTCSVCDRSARLVHDLVCNDSISSVPQGISHPAGCHPPAKLHGKKAADTSQEDAEDKRSLVQDQRPWQGCEFCWNSLCRPPGVASRREAN